jgi:hypothetical protein
MAEELERPMAEDELGTMTQTITLKKKPLPDGEVCDDQENISSKNLGGSC